MRRMFMVLMLAGMVSLVGCKKKPRQDVSEVPPPPPAEPVPAYTPAPAPAPAPAPVPVAVEPAPAPMPASPAATAQGRTYVVQRGDTLYSIARKFYGDARKVKDIAAANGLADPNKIKVGQKLTLP